MRVQFAPYFRANPYQNLLSSALRHIGVAVDVDDHIPLKWCFFSNRGRDLIHLHWIHPFYVCDTRARTWLSLKLLKLCLLWFKRRGGRVVWTLHNLVPHESKYPHLDREATRFLTREANGIIVHCEKARLLLDKFCGTCAYEKVHIIPHGHYMDVYENDYSQVRARKELGVRLSDTVYLFFGELKAYKGVENLVRAFHTIADDDIHLLIVGRPTPPRMEQSIRRAIGLDGRITLIPRYVAAHEVQIFFNACDVVVTPYKDVLSSGSIPLTLSFGRSCIAPRLGCVEEIVDERGAFLYKPASADGLCGALSLAFERRKDLASMGQHNRTIARQLSWDKVAQQTKKVYQAVLTER